MDPCNNPIYNAGMIPMLGYIGGYRRITEKKMETKGTIGVI